MKRGEWPEARAKKFRQAAFAYVHVGMLLEIGVYVMWREGLVAATRVGPAWLWLFVIVPLIVGAVAVGLYHWQNEWFARVIWLLHFGRLPSLVQLAFVTGGEHGVLRPGFWVAGIIVVVANLWMLARAGWDL